MKLHWQAFITDQEWEEYIKRTDEVNANTNLDEKQKRILTNGLNNRIQAKGIDRKGQYQVLYSHDKDSCEGPQGPAQNKDSQDQGSAHKSVKQNKDSQDQGSGETNTEQDPDSRYLWKGDGHIYKYESGPYQESETMCMFHALGSTVIKLEPNAYPETLFLDPKGKAPKHPQYGYRSLKTADLISFNPHIPETYATTLGELVAQKDKTSKKSKFPHLGQDFLDCYRRGDIVEIFETKEEKDEYLKNSALPDGMNRPRPLFTLADSSKKDTLYCSYCDLTSFYWFVFTPDEFEDREDPRPRCRKCDELMTPIPPEVLEVIKTEIW